MLQIMLILSLLNLIFFVLFFLFNQWYSINVMELVHEQDHLRP